MRKDGENVLFQKINISQIFSPASRSKQNILSQRFYLKRNKNLIAIPETIPNIQSDAFGAMQI